MAEPKPITEHLVDMLRERSARGQSKYGTTIDRGDLSRAEWLQHLLEELLDAAQYVEAAKRQAQPKIVAAVEGTNARVSLHRGESPAKLVIDDGTSRAVILLAGDVAASIVTLLGGNCAALVGRPASFPPAAAVPAVREDLQRDVELVQEAVAEDLRDESWEAWLRLRAALQAPPAAAVPASKDLAWWTGSLLIQCQQADVQGELPECIDGSVMDKLAAALAERAKGASDEA